MLHRPEPLARLLAALEGVERLVCDTLELRQSPAPEALERARPVLEALGEAVGEREVVLVPGNHDHGLARRWLKDAPPLGLEERVAPGTGSPAAARVAAWLGPARVEVAYPGVWLRDDVYATHGHYLDVHGTVPSFERIGAGAMARLVGAPPPARGPIPARRLSHALWGAARRRGTPGRTPTPPTAAPPPTGLLDDRHGRRGEGPQQLVQ